MRWIVDAQLPPALARVLAEEGHVAEHVNDVGMGAESDESIWDYALETSAVIITKDEDFRNRAMLVATPPVIIWLRIGNCSRQALLDWFEPLLAEIEASIGNGETVIEIR